MTQVQKIDELDHSSHQHRLSLQQKHCELAAHEAYVTPGKMNQHKTGNEGSL